MNCTNLPRQFGVWRNKPFVIIHSTVQQLEAGFSERVIINNNKRPLTPKSMPPAGDEHAKLKTERVAFIVIIITAASNYDVI